MRRDELRAMREFAGSGYCISEMNITLNVS